MGDEKPRHAFEDPQSNRPATSAPTEQELKSPHDPYAAFRHRGFRFYVAGNFISVVGRQMLSVAIGWEIYQRTHSATALGLTGLVLAIPVILFAVPAGQMADRFPRKTILLITQMISACTSCALAAVSFFSDRIPLIAPLAAGDKALTWIASVFEKSAHVSFSDPAIPCIYALLFVSGTSRAFNWAARAAFVPNLVSTSAFGNAITWSSATFEIGTVTGPAIGGILVAMVGFPFVYAIDAICALVCFLLVLPIVVKSTERPREKVGLAGLFSGLRFVWHTKIVLATITLDLFAVLLGGATALLPIFADQILHAGPIGLGWLRAAPSLGAFTMGLTLAHLPPLKNAGRTMILAVIGFGSMMILFGLSKFFWLSILALIAAGAFDNISVVVRHTLIQLLTPDAMRGRVSAVNNVFIGSSNELGAFESGMTAALFGPVLSVVGGGVGTILVVIGAIFVWPQLRRLGSFASVKPAQE